MTDQLTADAVLLVGPLGVGGDPVDAVHVVVGAQGIHLGEDLYENAGFIVHFFDRAKVAKLAEGFGIVSLHTFEEGSLPRRLFRVALEKL